ncbi:MAG: hypothetical protein V2J26_00985 [Pacificimonas sp.]|nr:hypothetical protein [Pacificimonas sp.]
MTPGAPVQEQAAASGAADERAASPAIPPKLLLISNASPEQTTGRLFRKLADRLRAESRVELRFRTLPRGVVAKVAALAMAFPGEVAAVARADKLFVHSAFALNLPTILVAKLLGKPVSGFLWDIYPQSMATGQNRGGRLAHALFSALERFAMHRADTIIVPNDDYRLHERLPPLRSVEVVPIWPVDAIQDATASAPSPGKEVRIAWTGQLLATRGVGHAIRQIAAAFPGYTLAFHVFSPDPLPSGLAATIGDVGADLCYHGYVSLGELEERLRQMHFGIVSLDPALPEASFPSKSNRYISSGLPILYSGPPLPGLKAALIDGGVGLSANDGPIDADTIGRFFRAYPENRLAYVAAIEAAQLRLLGGSA